MALWNDARLLIRRAVYAAILAIGVTKRGVEVISMPTAEACRLLQGLEPHEAAAVLHVTC